MARKLWAGKLWLGSCRSWRGLRGELEPLVDGWPILPQEIPTKSPALVGCVTDQGVPNPTAALWIVGVGQRFTRQWAQQSGIVNHLPPRVAAGEYQAVSGVLRRLR